jgi:hydrogenase maturation protein HypF
MDGASWGGEFLVGNSSGFIRAAHFAPKRMPGGNVAVTSTWRMAASYLRDAFGENMTQRFPEFFERRTEEELNAVEFALRTNTNAPVTTSCGRLFDATASLIGLYDSVSFEAQAAIAFEHLALKGRSEPYEYTLSTSDTMQISFDAMIRQVVEDMRNNAGRSEIASRVHWTIIDACVSTAGVLREKYDIHTAALSGGVFQNALIFEGLSARLEDKGFRVLTHRLVPANDGGIALGQAAIAQTQLRG